MGVTVPEGVQDAPAEETSRAWTAFSADLVNIPAALEAAVDDGAGGGAADVADVAAVVAVGADVAGDAAAWEAGEAGEDGVVSLEEDEHRGTVRLLGVAAIELGSLVDCREMD